MSISNTKLKRLNQEVFNMTITLMLIISLIANLGANITKKHFTNNNPDDISGGFVFNAVTCLIAAIALIRLGGFGTASLFTIALGLVFGFVSALQGITNIAALQCGPMSSPQS